VNKTFNDSSFTYVETANDLYTFTDKYEMTALHEFVVDHMLPEAWARVWDGGRYKIRSALRVRPKAIDFRRDHYDHFAQYFHEYPRDLWSFYITALLHYQRAEPESDLFRRIVRTDPEMADYVVQALCKKVLAGEDKVEKLNEEVEQIRKGRRRYFR
jgi:hypothetical protein